MKYFCRNCNTGREFIEDSIDSDMYGTLTCKTCKCTYYRSTLETDHSTERKKMFYCIGDRAFATAHIAAGNTIEEALRNWAGNCTDEDFVELVTTRRPTIIEGIEHDYKLMVKVEVSLTA